MNFNSWLDKQLFYVTEASGFLTQDKTRYIFCILLVYPLSLLFRLLPPNATLKHLVGMALGVWMGYFCIGTDIIHSFISSTVVYLMVEYLDPKLSHKVVFIFCFAYIVISHLYRLYVDYLGWTLDFSGIQMLLTLRLTAYAFNVYDGTLSEKDLACPELKESRLPRKVSMIEYYGYVYFFSFFLAGPAIEMKTYLDFINMNLFKLQKGDQLVTKAEIPPGSVIASLSKLGYALIPWSLCVVAQNFYPVAFCLTPEFIAWPFIFRLVYHWFSVSLIRATYYFAWILAEGGNVMVGIGFSGYKEVNGVYVPTWERACNVHALGFEFAQNVKEVTGSWNLYTENWLRHHIYFRVKKSDWKAYDVLATYFTSAFWHGFYPGYYLSLIHI
eukprot:TRINITY_DN8099_c0_g1_i3.p1 TRINITY_DN8099_c0_g1~~TRINITY_DN8099_c0_g1_i3.p1  ORF type:complete len:385 (+),score=31.10 TRINITY_DN8099_c0_g1_i3:55-1209(+)